MLGDGASPQDVVELRTSLGLDRPLLEQYVTFLRHAITGDLGLSFRTGQPVTAMIVERLPATAELALAAMIVAVVIALPLGIVAAVWRGTVADYGAMTFALAGVSIPNFWLGPLLAMGFAVELGWLPVSGRGAVADYGAMPFALAGVSIPNFWLGPLLALVFAVELGWLPVSGRGTLVHLILPAVSLGLALAAILARMTRASLLDELRELYVRAARARGVSRVAAVTMHALRNSLVPLLTIVALQFGAVLTGAVITETIFAWPGIGRLLIQSIGFRDYPMVQGCILLIAVTYVTVNLVTDLMYGVLDPRIRLE